MTIRNLFSAAALIVVVVGTACDKATAPLEHGDPTITVNPTSLNLTVGQASTVNVTIANDTTGAQSGVTWSSSLPAVATVSSTGAVTAVAPGTATILATSKFRPAIHAAVQVVVTSGIVDEQQLTLVPSSASLQVGKSLQLVVTPPPATNYTWSSSSSGTASVDSNGNVTALATGTAVITARSKQDATKSVQSVFTVVAAAPVTLPVIGAGLVPERYTAEIAVRDGFAYTTSWGNRGTVGNSVKVWSVSGATPVLVDSLKLTSANTTSDVQISPDGTLLVVSTEGGGGGSIAIYSRTNPGHPTLISRYSTAETVRGVHTVKLSVINGKLYGFLQIDQGGGLLAQEVIVDMSDPANVKQVFAQAMGNPYVHDVFVRDGLLFAALWNDGMTIFDVGGGGRGGSPSNPVQISNVRTVTGEIHNIWWFQDPRGGASAKRYVFLGEEGAWNGVFGGPNSTTAGDIHVVDINDITAPKEVAIYSLADQKAGTHNFFVDEASGILYAAYYNGGVRAIDIRGDLGTCTTAQRASYTSVTGQQLCDLRLMGREAGTGLTSGGYFVWGVTMQGNTLYASDMGKGLVVLDATALKR